MANISRSLDEPIKSPRRKPPRSPEEQENYLISLANKRAEERLRNGKATSQEILHFLKLGSQKEILEKEKAIEEIKLLRAKTESLESMKNIEELYSNALKSMKIYQGQDEEEDNYDE